MVGKDYAMVCKVVLTHVFADHKGEMTLRMPVVSCEEGMYCDDKSIRYDATCVTMFSHVKALATYEKEFKRTLDKSFIKASQEVQASLAGIFKRLSLTPFIDEYRRKEKAYINHIYEVEGGYLDISRKDISGIIAHCWDVVPSV